MPQDRNDDFNERRQHLQNLSEEQLENKFWDLLDQIVDPLIAEAKTHTTPSIERSVLLRMGFSSLEAKALVEKVINHELMGKGAGHVVYALQQKDGCTIREAGLKLLSDDEQPWQDVQEYFKGGLSK